MPASCSDKDDCQALELLIGPAEASHLRPGLGAGLALQFPNSKSLCPGGLFSPLRSQERELWVQAGLNLASRGGTDSFVPSIGFGGLGSNLWRPHSRIPGF